MILRNIEFNRDVDLDVIIPSMKADHRGLVLSELAKIIGESYQIPVSDIQDHIEITITKDNVSLGGGIIVPAITLKNIRRPMTILINLEKPIDWDTADNQPADIICCVVSPEKDKPLQLRRLSRICRLLKNKELVQKIRETDDSDTIRALIHNPEGWMMAA